MLDEILRLRLNKIDKEKIRAAAKSLNMNMSKFVLKCVMDKVEEILKENE